MKKEEMINHLTQRSEELKKEMIQIQESFNLKKEQLIKIEGALEVLSILDDEGSGDVVQEETSEIQTEE